jgi:hypothetical protein
MSKNVHGVELDFQRGLDYFAPDVPTSQRRTIMRGFVRDVRNRMEAARREGARSSSAPPPPPMALGVRLTPSWQRLREQGLDGLRTLVTPVGGGGEGVTYHLHALIIIMIGTPD